MTTIRRLGVHDTTSAGELTALFGDPDAGPADLDAWLADDAHVMIGAWQGDVPVGMVYGYHLGRPDERPDMLLLYSIDVAPTVQRQGIGRSLVEAFRAQARGTVWLITNESNDAAMALYAASGGSRPHTDDAMFCFQPPA